MQKSKKYDKEFKINHLKLYKERGKHLDEIANNLGILKSTLYISVQKYKKYGEDNFPVSTSIKVCNKEVHHLHKELANVKQEENFKKQ